MSIATGLNQVCIEWTYGETAIGRGSRPGMELDCEVTARVHAPSPDVVDLRNGATPGEGPRVEVLAVTLHGVTVYDLEDARVGVALPYDSDWFRRTERWLRGVAQHDPSFCDRAIREAGY